jgi:hypothetical protein
MNLTSFAYIYPFEIHSLVLKQNETKNDTTSARGEMFT